MAFELIGARLLMPSFGMGIEVWAIVIAVSLGAIAVGYAAGGKIIDKWPRALTPAIVLLLACISLLAIRLWATAITSAFSQMPLVKGVGCSAVTILTLPMMLLGMIPPMLAKLLLRGTTNTGTIVGGLMAVGTAGSVLGTILTGIVLIPRIGVSKTLAALAILTALFAVLILLTNGRRRTSIFTAVITAAVIWFALSIKSQQQEIGPMRVLESVEGLYGHLEVLEHNGAKALLCNGIFQTVVPASTLGVTRGMLIQGRDYIELIPYFRPECRSALLIGVAGALHEQALAQYGIEVYGVEIEPAVILLAVEYFYLAADVTIADGRAFLVRDKRRYDTIILDAFVGGSAPEHLYTREAFEQMAERLNPNGIVAIRLIGHPGHPATRAVARTLEAVFPHFVAVRSGIADELQHVFLFGSQGPVELASLDYVELARYGFTGEEFCEIDTAYAKLLTDDKSPLALLSSDIMAQHRHNSLQLRRNPLW
jgi:spermidine synthase